MNRCILPEEFQRLVAEQLSEGERQALDAHVDACARCQESLALLLDDALLGQLLITVSVFRDLRPMEQ